jgi:DNA topoisomerase IB
VAANLRSYVRRLISRSGNGRRTDSAAESRQGFAYYGPDGDLLCEADTLRRIRDLVIPPAWKKVWVCP